jgi:polar amino acid transport system substrate-binding protein
VSPAALKGKSIAPKARRSTPNSLEKHYKDANIKLYPTQEEANLDLQNGRLDFVVADKLVLVDFVNGQGKDC